MQKVVVKNYCYLFQGMTYIEAYIKRKNLLYKVSNNRPMSEEEKKDLDALTEFLLDMEQDLHLYKYDRIGYEPDPSAIVVFKAVNGKFFANESDCKEYEAGIMKR